MKTIKTIDCVLVCNLLLDASLGKMRAEDKYAVIKSIKVMKPVKTDFEEFRTTAADKLKSDNHEEMQAMARKWHTDGDNCGLTVEQKHAVNDYFERYASQLEACVNEEAQKEMELDMRAISEESFCALLDANPSFSVEQIMKLEEVLCL